LVCGRILKDAPGSSNDNPINNNSSIRNNSNNIGISATTTESALT
jgi:hypothetical protein